MAYYSFDERHNGPDAGQISEMLNAIGADGTERLISETIPASIRIKGDLKLQDAMTEQEYLRMLREVSVKNRIFRIH